MTRQDPSPFAVDPSTMTGRFFLPLSDPSGPSYHRNGIPQGVQVVTLPESRTLASAPRRKAMAVFRRRAWVLLLPTLLVPTLAWLLAAQAPVSYRAQTVLNVPERVPGIASTTPDPSISRAKNYATAVPVLDKVIASAAKAGGVAVADVKARLVVSNDERTTLIRLTYTGATEKETLAVLNDMGRTLTASPPPAPILAGALQVLTTPTTAEASSISPKTGGAMGLLTGLALGLLMSIVLERNRPRVDTVADLERVTGAPALDVSEVRAHEMEELRRFWDTSEGGRRELFLVPVGEASGYEIADLFGHSISAQSAPTSGQSGGQAVIVASPGDTAARVRATVDRLRAMGLSVALALIAKDAGVLGAAAHERPAEGRRKRSSDLDG